MKVKCPNCLKVSKLKDFNYDSWGCELCGEHSEAKCPKCHYEFEDTDPIYFEEA